MTDDAFDGRMSAREVKTRASSAAVLLMGRGAAFQALGFLGSLVLARLLVPEDFGIVAVGLTILNIGRSISGAGLGSALVARAEPPTRDELRALAGLQLVITSCIAATAAAGAFAIGGQAPITALMVLALPLTALRMPAMLLFQRQLEFLAPVKVEIAEILVYLAISIALAVAGMGAWSLAIAVVARAFVGTALAIRISPLGFVDPSLDFARLRSIIGFGWRFQAVGWTQLAFESALTAGIGAIAGLSALGLWSFASRLLGIPRILFESMWSVGFPAFSRLMESEDSATVGPLLERTVGTFAVAASALLCPLVAASPALVPLLFGADWTDVSLILPGAALALIIAGPIGLATSAYFYARGDAGTGLKMSIVTDIVRAPVTFVLLSTMGVAGLGIGWLAGSLAGMAYTVPLARRASGARLGLRVLGPALCATIAGLAGWLVTDELGVTVAAAVLSAATASGLWLALMAVVSRSTLIDGFGMCRAILTSAFAGFRARRRGAPVPAASSGV
jgi:polysaccharide transporter, PST family